MTRSNVPAVTGVSASSIVAAAGILIGIFIHVQVVLPLGGLRTQLALSDLLLPVVALPIMLLALRHTRRAELHNYRLIIISVIALSLVLCLSAMISMLRQGELTPWALKKLAGWPVLIAYLVTGFTCAALALRQPSGANWRQIHYAYAGTAVVIALPVTILSLLATAGWTGLIPFSASHAPGLTDRPISYVLLCLFSALLLPHMGSNSRLWKLFRLTGLVALLCAIFLTASRAGVLASGIVFVAAIAFGHIPRLASLAAVSISASLIVVVLVLTPPTSPGVGHSVVQRLANENSTTASDNMRVRAAQYRESGKLIRQFPLTGAGLGAYLEHAKKLGPMHALVIHNTGLWLLVESGPFGLIALLFFFGVAIFRLWPWRTHSVPETRPVIHAAFWLIVAAAGASMFHELLYQRILWFALGLGLAAASIRRPPIQDTPETAPARPMPSAPEHLRASQSRRG